MPSAATRLGSPTDSAARAPARLGRQHHQRVVNARQLGHALEQLDPARVVAAEHVALARPPPLGREQVPLGDVADVDHVGLPVHHGR